MTASQDLWSQVDLYLEQTLGLSDAVLDAALSDAAAAGLPDIGVTPSQGALLQLLARSVNAKSILEIGTLGGYSTIWLGRALPAGGRMISLEINPAHAAVARANLERARLGSRCEVRVGPALDVLPRLESGSLVPFDFVFIDADKPSIPDYFGWALRLTRPGGLIVVDNVVRKGAVADARSTDPSVRGVRQLLDLLAVEPRVSASVLQTVGRKGYDGLAVALVLDAD